MSTQRDLDFKHPSNHKVGTNSPSPRRNSESDNSDKNRGSNRRFRRHWQPLRKEAPEKSRRWYFEGKFSLKSIWMNFQTVLHRSCSRNRRYTPRFQGIRQLQNSALRNQSDEDTFGLFKGASRGMFDGHLLCSYAWADAFAKHQRPDVTNMACAYLH